MQDEEGNYLDEEGNVVEKENRVKNELYKKYNWPNSESINNWWGFPDKDDTFEGRPADNGGEGTNTGNSTWLGSPMQYVRPFGYTATLNVPDDWRWISGATCYQIGLQIWGDGSDYFSVMVDALTVNDDDGNVLVAFDGLGNEIDEAKLKEIVDKHAEGAGDEPTGGDTPADTSDGAENTAAGDGNTAATEAAPSDSNAPVTTAAPASSSSNGLPVGAIVGIIAGVIVVIVVVVIIVMKKKK